MLPVLVTETDKGEEGEPFALSFVLTEGQAGPFPVATETLWCRPEGDNYRVRNIPFFIDEISLDDIISVRALENGFFEIAGIIVRSQNSTVWLYFKDGTRGTALVEKLLSFGCGVEGGVIDGYYAINVPKSVDIELVYSAIDEAEQEGIVIVDYPSIRQ